MSIETFLGIVFVLIVYFLGYFQGICDSKVFKKSGGDKQ